MFKNKQVFFWIKIRKNSNMNTFSSNEVGKTLGACDIGTLSLMVERWFEKIQRTVHFRYRYHIKFRSLLQYVFYGRDIMWCLYPKWTVFWIFLNLLSTNIHCFLANPLTPSMSDILSVIIYKPTEKHWFLHVRNHNEIHIAFMIHGWTNIRSFTTHQWMKWKKKSVLNRDHHKVWWTIKFFTCFSSKLLISLQK